MFYFFIFIIFLLFFYLFFGISHGLRPHCDEVPANGRHLSCIWDYAFSSLPSYWFAIVIRDELTKIENWQINEKWKNKIEKDENR